MKLKLVMAMSVALLCGQAYADVDISPATAQTVSQDKNRQIGEEFLKNNKSKPGVVTLPDGLQYKIITPGTEFDSSAKHGGTIDFPVGQVIPGWVEALKMMQPGATWELYIPSDLAYGEAGAPPAIGPNETLIFKVKLVNVKKA
jgi:FKBP-type peptidyl-prolyl cis-trans isomerase FklB